MTSKPKRYQNQRCLHFITFSCFQRRQLLEAAVARETFERELERVRHWYGCYVTGYVVMPEHVHLLISEPERGKLSVVIQMLKQITSRRLRPAELRRFWQVRYYDFPVWSEQKRVEKLRYIHRNPVHRGLVSRPEEWKWSSFLPWATGAEGPVEIECSWTAQRRNEHRWCGRSCKPTLPHKTREGCGNPIGRTEERMGQPPGLYYHLKGDTDVPNDPWDKTGWPWITNGADDGRDFSKRGGGCGCH